MLKQSEIVEKLSEQLQVSKSQAEQFVKAFGEIVENDLVETGKTKILGMGTLNIRYRFGRNGVNPRNTEETISIPESLSVGLSASKSIKDRLRDEVDISLYRKEKKDNQ
ncbi:MAG: HU family DNA-binding protein [Paraclostridium sp.]